MYMAYTEAELNDAEQAVHNNYRQALAATLTRLRRTVEGDGANEDDRGYIRALNHVAIAYAFTSVTESIVVYKD